MSDKEHKPAQSKEPEKEEKSSAAKKLADVSVELSDLGGPLSAVEENSLLDNEWLADLTKAFFEPIPRHRLSSLRSIKDNLRRSQLADEFLTEIAKLKSEINQKTQALLEQIGADFTVVGTPVVYACRMGGADAGQTYINQPAFEKLFGSYSAVCDFEEGEITIKHEGKTLAYSVELNGKEFEPKLPDWTKEEAANTSPAAKAAPAKTN